MLKAKNDAVNTNKDAAIQAAAASAHALAVKNYETAKTKYATTKADSEK